MSKEMSIDLKNWKDVMVLGQIVMKTTVSDCARCGETHDVGFAEFVQNPIELEGDIFTHWGMCPNLHEPILMRETKEPIERLSKSG